MSLNSKHLLTTEGAQNFLVEVLKEKDPDLLAVAVLFLIKARASNRSRKYQGPLRVESLFGELGFEVKVQ